MPPKVGKVGKIAVVSEISSRPWIFGEKRDISNTKPVKDAVKEAQHKIFYSCAEIAEDSFWKNIFNKASTGTFPKGFSYNNSNLTFKKGTRTETIHIPENPHEAISLLKDFFQKTGLFSKKDFAESDKILKKLAETTVHLEDMEWSKIRKKGLREVLINEYIQRKSLEYPEDLRKQFSCRIHIAINLGMIGPKHINFSRGSIQNIEGIYYNDKTHAIEYGPALHVKTTRARPKEKPAERFLQKWNSQLSKSTNTTRHIYLEEYSQSEYRDDETNDTLISEDEIQTDTCQ